MIHRDIIAFSGGGCFINGISLLPFLRMSASRLYLAYDIGAASGPKLALYSGHDHRPLLETLSGDQYHDDFDHFVSQLIEAADAKLAEVGRTRRDLEAVGIATAGILDAEGRFRLFHNRPQYNGKNLRIALEEEFGVPAAIANDADAGALAEWGVLRLELLYWVFGGGWGGAWVSADGQIRFPSTAWTGEDADLHFTNEPGFAIGLERRRLRYLFGEVNASFDLFLEELTQDPLLPQDSLKGPGCDPDTLRAEVLLSGTGRRRIFQVLAGAGEISHEVGDTAATGAYISRLSRMRVEKAVNTDRLYGKILAEATRILLERAEADGLPKGVPICLGGKPSYALPFFGPSTQRLLGKMGFHNYMRPSVIDERGSNANLAGASELAHRAVRT